MTPESTHTFMTQDETGLNAMPPAAPPTKDPMSTGRVAPPVRAVATAAPPSIMTVENTDWPMLLAISTGSICPDATR